MTRPVLMLTALISALCLSACLISADPVIAEDSAEFPLEEGEYRIFAIEEDGSHMAEEFFSLERQGADYLMAERYGQSNDAVWVRMREVSEDLYAVQALEVADQDEYVYVAMTTDGPEPMIWFLDCTKLTDAEITDLGLVDGPFGTCETPDWTALSGAIELLMPRSQPSQIWRKG